MTHSADPKWAQENLIDVLNGPQPADETGPNAHFRSTFAPVPDSTSTSETSIPVNMDAFKDFEGAHHPTGRTDPAIRTSGAVGGAAKTTRSRGNSLSQRFPGDMSHRPLDVIKKENKAAQRSAHLQQGHIPVPDAVDKLDAATLGLKYHHEGPYDATLYARNADPKTAPLEAVKESNLQTLRATPKEFVEHALRAHQPLDGVASIPPGETDGTGKKYEYKETNVVNECGGEHRKGDVDFVEFGTHKDTKEHPSDMHACNLDVAEATGIEMQEHPHDGYPHNKKHVHVNEMKVPEEQGESSKRHSLDGLKKRIGSLHKKKH